MKKQLFILLSGLLFLPTFCQSQIEEIYKRNTFYATVLGYYNRAEYDKAIIYCDSLLQCSDNKYVYLHGRVAAANNDFNKATILLKQAIREGVTLQQIERNYDFDKYIETDYFASLKESYPTLHQHYLDSIDDLNLDEDYMKELDNLLYVDQFIRKNGSIRKLAEDTSVFKKTPNWIIEHLVDSLNFERLIELSREKGFPIPKNVRNNPAWVLLWHHRAEEFYENSQWERIKPFIDKELKEGNLAPDFYAKFEDHYRYTKGFPQLYGSMCSYFRQSKNYDSLQFEKPEELNVRRRKIGLCSIEIEVWSFGMELPKSLKNIKFK